ncbi:Glycogen debranching enzyme [Vibrio chagasii]|nr:Glycogen debranching enzyme [Vibrio chagasii]
MNDKQSKHYPLGATLNLHGCNFAIHAPDCDTMSIALFYDDGVCKVVSIESKTEDVFHVFIDGITNGQKYGYIVDKDGKQLLISDPYAKAIDKPLHYTPPFNQEKSFHISKCVVTSDSFDWGDVQKPRIPLEETVVFETHTKGLTKLNTEIDESVRGTYLGLISESMLEFYREQSITTIQLLPVAACMHEYHLLDTGKVNYWGYNPFLFMAPDPRFAKEDAVIELKTAIRELHRNGIEVILDVVYNHTAEGGGETNVFNLKALDERYYLKHGVHHMNYTGCGNTVDMTHQASLNLVMDTLRYWVKEFKVDGFRFDLAATLGREGHNFNRHAGFFKAVGQDPILKGTKLIAEPWDIGPNGYQVGNFPRGWNETNDKLRDTVKSFWRGDRGYLRDLATRIMGSQDLYHAHRWPKKLTVNYVTYHDGFTLEDVVSYCGKHNEANGEGNRDGHGDNRSHNYGVEGFTDDYAVNTFRLKQKCNMMTTLLFSFGIPHILTADVLSHSQNGNNNAYCQDNEISWLNWEKSDAQAAFKIWLANTLEARKKYMVPFIKAFSGKNTHNRTRWAKPCGSELWDGDWDNLTTVSLHLGIEQHGAEMVYLINKADHDITYSLPKCNQQEWQVIVSTCGTMGAGAVFVDEMKVKADSVTILHYNPTP